MTINYIFSNSNDVIYFQYVPIVGIDHRMIVARYNITLAFQKETVPPERYFSGWVILEDLDEDIEFVEQAKYIISKVLKYMMNLC